MRVNPPRETQVKKPGVQMYFWLHLSLLFEIKLIILGGTWHTAFRHQVCDNSVVLISGSSAVETFSIWESVVLLVLQLLIRRSCVCYRNCGENQEKFSLFNVSRLNLKHFIAYSSSGWDFLNVCWWFMKLQNHSAQQAITDVISTFEDTENCKIRRHHSLKQ